MAQRTATEEIFFTSVRGGQCERSDESCFFPDLEETGDVLCKEINVKISK